MPKNLICIVVDRLHAGMVGAYGNSWIQSRALDRLASESFLFDQAFCDCPQLPAIYRGYWHGLPATRPAQAASEPGFLQLLSRGGWHTAIVTDESEVAERPEASHFAERILVESPSSGQTAKRADDTAIARVLAAAAGWLDAAKAPFVLWIHLRGMGAAWDAPLAYRNRFAEEDDPEPPTFVDVPNRRLSDDHDPDELLGITHAYAGQVSLFDECLGTFLDQFRNGPWATSTQLSLLSARGFPLGEHLRVGPSDDALYNELVQIPWMMRFPDGLGTLARSQALVRPADLPGTLLDWLDIDRNALGPHATSLLGIVRDEVEQLRDHVLFVVAGERAIRTPAWHLRQPEGGKVELFSKPGDRWEVNEVANRCPEIVSELEKTLVEGGQAGENAEAVALAAPLVTEVD